MTVRKHYINILGNLSVQTGPTTIYGLLGKSPFLALFYDKQTVLQFLLHIAIVFEEKSLLAYYIHIS